MQKQTEPGKKKRGIIYLFMVSKIWICQIVMTKLELKH